MGAVIFFGAGGEGFSLLSFQARFPKPSGPVLAVPEPQYHCGVSSGSTAAVRGAVQDSQQQLCSFSWPGAHPTCPHQTTTRAPGVPSRISQLQQPHALPGPGRRSHGEVAKPRRQRPVGPFKVEVQLWPSATAEPSLGTGLGEAPPHQRCGTESHPPFLPLELLRMGTAAF